MFVASSRSISRPPPGLSGRLHGRLTTTSGGIVIQEQQHVPDPRRTPERIPLAQAADQLLDLQGHRLAARFRLPSPPRSKGAGVPAFHRFGLHDMDKLFPTVQELREHCPEDPKGWAELVMPPPPARRAIQFDRQLALDRQQLSRRHRSRQEQRPAESQDIPEELEEDTQGAAGVADEIHDPIHLPRIPRRRGEMKPYKRPGQHFRGDTGKR
jgi:hypothetical protein